jgi:hypothetical protein
VALMMRAVTIVASLASAVVLVQGTDPLDAAEITCSTWQGLRTCSSPSGALSTEWQWQGMTFGQDSDGNHWTTSWWLGIDITTVNQPPER